ncbi:uncharacterized protein L3040_002086 [Drepanopeziza brunnea f. sp. 'multigermtubi']|uniref:Peroxidase n=1 Tax=Marssonina brunnea f. sp. multigermtubi (strain MB_m1) TaxID=1072389 RepID=K1X0J2_MARBU|nr:L-ascorbate oxidase [Drepanopeziza brunnea f. sp. 'multigermtubi' MB_m1]EKD18661.1 L-ascorbate oxidase [Drepanopeziza brunnea f. sp. 'multigermtubi' MB_m1]KAJ5052334.1 hypothetical protein L3040_002086 [Drepanopeziza brunnea f. sp. 'multigermtubi']
MFSSARTICLGLCVATTTLAFPTWPDKTDELEQTMFVASGYGRRGFLDDIPTCGFSHEGPEGLGRINSAEWIRNGFHDMSTADVIAGTGGLDGSIMFETERLENDGPAFNHTLGFLGAFYGSETSISDLIALAVWAAVRQCGGPLLTMRAGRVDATEAGPYGVPEPQENITSLTDKFARQGFNSEEMIALIACGHTLGGVHGAQFPTIVPDAGTAGNNFSTFDSTTRFDNMIATEYIAGTTTNPLVVGADPALNSDARVFSLDGNATMQSLTDPAVFADTCARLLTRMIDTVPAGVVLSEPLEAYDVKPGLLNLELSEDGRNVTFTGNIRVKTTSRPRTDITSVSLLYTALDGTTGTILTRQATFQGGSATGLTDDFQHYEIFADLPASSSISSFTVSIALTNGTVETYDNNGVGYPVSSTIMLSNSRSCLRTDLPYKATIVAAVRGTFAPEDVKIVYTVPVPRQGSIIPSLVTKNATMALNSTLGDFGIYSVDVPLLVDQLNEITFDLYAGENKDYYRNAANFQSCS